MHVDKKALKHLEVAIGDFCPVVKPGVSPQNKKNVNNILTLCHNFILCSVLTQDKLMIFNTVYLVRKFCF